MSLSGSASESYNKTNDAQLHYDEPKGPEPTAENPGGVFPQSTSQAANTGTTPGSGPPDHGGDVRGVFGNPEMFKDVFHDLSGAFTKALQAIEDESPSGTGSVAKALAARLNAMRDEIDGWRMGKGLPEAEGGEKNDQVDRAEGDGGGLYKE